MFFGSIIFAQSSALSLVIPQHNQVWHIGELYEIAWTYKNLHGKVEIFYSNTGTYPWYLIDKVNVVEKNIYFFIDDSYVDIDGRVSIKIQSTEEKSVNDRVTIIIAQEDSQLDVLQDGIGDLIDSAFEDNTTCIIISSVILIALLSI